nr:RNA-directed DNA polymerase, eukaryota, reverse transcriptase zinc-binding domain protein [Tanacetum cinerariifolium]
PITMERSDTEFDNLIIDISNMEIDDLVEFDTCVWSLSNDDSFSVNSVRKHIDEHSLPSLFSCTWWHVESNDHIFFTCDTAVAIWNLVRSWIDLPLPSFLSCEDWTNWFDSWHVSKDKKSHDLFHCWIFDFYRSLSDCRFFCESNDKTESPKVGKNIAMIITRDLISKIVGYATGAAAHSHHCVSNPP